MIRSLTGKIEYIGSDSIVINVNGVGFEVYMPTIQIEQLTYDSSDTKVYTYTSVREDNISLFGFLNKNDLEMFEKLITVSGIGPKGAVSIISILPSDELKIAILSGDSKAIAKASGIGKKTAEKCILELKDKISVDDAFLDMKAVTEPVSYESGAVKEAVEALTSLGYSNSEAVAAVKQVIITEDDSVEDILKEALKYII